MLKAALQMIFPEQCPLCSELVESQGGLCGSCWTETPFIHGTVCNACGAPEIGPSAGDEVICDSCRAHPRPWRAGRSVLRYSGGGRRLVLALKHSDRLDLVPTLAHWMAERAKLYATPGSVVVPVPCHWRRLLQRRYNQAAALARPIAAELGMTYCPDALWRPRAT
ncbi:MAG: double zinc ribbon domain-containing protein, partial [Mangrovicoccus sp.]